MSEQPTQNQPGAGAAPVQASSPQGAMDRSNSVSNWNRTKPSSPATAGAAGAAGGPGSAQTLRPGRPRGEHAPSLPPKPRSATTASLPANQQGAYPNATGPSQPMPQRADSPVGYSNPSNQIRSVDGSRAEVAVQMLQVRPSQTSTSNFKEPFLPVSLGPFDGQAHHGMFFLAPDSILYSILHNMSDFEWTGRDFLIAFPLVTRFLCEPLSA